VTKPAPPSQPTEELVEMEAMDLEEWEQDQHTPQAPDAKLAELVKQSAEASPPVPVRHTQSQTVARVIKQPPPTPGGLPNQVRFGPPEPPKPGEMSPFDMPTTVNAGAALIPTRSMTATPAAGTSTTNRHTTTRSATPAATPRLQPTAVSGTATPAGPMPRLQPTAVSGTATPAGGSPTATSQTATPAGGTPTGAGARTAAALRGLSTPSGGTPTAGAPPPVGAARTQTQAIGRIERTPASPAPAAPTPVAASPASRATPPSVPRSTATPVGGVPAVSANAAATAVGGAPVVSAKMTQAIGAVDRAPAPPSRATPPARSATPAGGVPARSVTPAGGVPADSATPAGGVPADSATPAGGAPVVSAKVTHAIGAIERAPSATAVPPTKLAEPVAGEESVGWSLPDDFDEVAAQEWKAQAPAASTPESTASHALAMPTAAVSPNPRAPSPSVLAPEPTASAPLPEPTPLPAPLPAPTPVAAPATGPVSAPLPESAPLMRPPATEFPPEPSVAVSTELFAQATSAGGDAPVPAAPSAPRAPQPPLVGPQPFVTQSSVQPHSQPVHVIQAPQPVDYPPAPMPPMPTPSAPMPSAPMFEEGRRDRHATTDSHRAIGGAKKPWLLIGGGVGAVALIVIIVMMMRGKSEPKVADKPAKPTPDRVDPVGKSPPDEVVAVVTPDAAETLPPDDTTPPPTTNPTTNTPPDTGKPKTPGTPKTPKIRGTKTTPIETGKRATDPVSTGGGGDGEKSGKAQAAYKVGNQKLFAGDPKGAIAAYRQVIELGSSSGYRGLGLAYAQQGDTANAIAAFKKYLAMSPKAADVAVIKKRLAALQGK